VFELVQRAPASAELTRWLALYEQGIADYRFGFYAHAALAFAQAQRLRPDPVSQLYEIRCARLREEPPTADWDGVFRAEK
jgi:hypothetical protein